MALTFGSEIISAAYRPVEQEFVRRQQQRIARIEAAQHAYDGQFPVPLVPIEGQANDSITLGLCTLIVDTGVSFLLGDPSAGNAVAINCEAAQDQLDALWAANDRDIWLNQVAISGGVAGDVFIKLRKSDERGIEALNIDPATIYALYDPDDYRKVVEWRIEWQGVNPRTGRAILRRQVITVSEWGKWEIIDYAAQGNGQLLEVGRDVWPWDWCPIVHAQNMPRPNEFYGASDLEGGIIGLNEAINRTGSNIARILRFHAHPKTWAKGTKPDAIKVNVDNIICLPDGAEIGNLEMQSDLGSSLEWFQKQLEAFSAVTRVPQIAMGRAEGLGQLSGVALQVLYQPLTEKTGTKRLLYGDMIETVSEHMLEMAGTPGAEVEVVWPNSLPMDALEAPQVAKAWEDAGLVRESALRKAGVENAEEEAAKAAAEEEAAAQREAQMGDQLLRAFDRGQTDSRGRMMRGQE